MKRKSIFILAVIAVIGLAACSKKEETPIETSALATIEPESSSASDEISDKLEDGDTLKVAPESIYIIDGEQMDESEYAEYQESLQGDVEEPTDADGNEIPGGYGNTSVAAETDTTEEIISYSVEENAPEESTEAESLSEEQVNEMIDNINDFTYKQAVENTRISIKYDLAELRGTNAEFADITDEMVDNYTEEELDALMQKIMIAKGF